MPRRWAVGGGLGAAAVLVAGVWMAGPLPRPELPQDRPAPAGATFTYPDFPNLPETASRRAAGTPTGTPSGTKGALRARIRTLGADELLVVLAHEQAHGNRTRVLRAIDDRFQELQDLAG